MPISSPDDENCDKVRLLYDTAAERSLISASQLNLPIPSTIPLSIIPIGGNVPIQINLLVQFKVKSLQDPNIHSIISAYVIPGVF